MRIEEFNLLSYKDQLNVIRSLGKLKHSNIEDDYQVSLFKIKNFYVELTRSIKELFFEKIKATDDLPPRYAQLKLHKDPW